MKHTFSLFFLCLVLIKPGISQHLIGLSKEDVMTAIKKSYPEFVIDHSSVNHTYKYLKFVDRNGEKTLLVFLSEKDNCTSTKLMSDYLYLNDVKKGLNKKYKKSGQNKWSYNKDNQTYEITLKQEEWFFTLFTGKK